MSGFVGNVTELTRRNEFFRRVLFTAPHSQLVAMCLRPNEEIGTERHDQIDQFLRVEQGQGFVVLDGISHAIADGDGIVVPAGTEHNIINASPDRTLLLSTIYSPPAHRDLLVHATKDDAIADEADHLPPPVRSPVGAA